MQNLILLHGALGCSSDLESLSSRLKTGGISVHSFSFSGHGNTNFRASFSIPQFAFELEEFITAKKLHQPAVFGYSLGGFVALYLSSKKPELLSKIITLGTKFNWTKEVVDKETKMLDPDLLAQKVPAFAKQLEIKHGVEWRELLVRTAALMREIGQNDFLSAGVIRTINTQTLIGIADKDQMVTIEETLQVFKSLPRSSMFMLPNTKHQIETVNNELLSKLINDFLVNP